MTSNKVLAFINLLIKFMKATGQEIKNMAKVISLLKKTELSLREHFMTITLLKEQSDTPMKIRMKAVFI